MKGKRDIALLGSAIILALSALGQLGADPAKLTPGQPTEPYQRAEPTPSVLELPPLEAFSEVVSRPLFLPTRRPIVDAAPVSQALANTETETAFKLTGVVIVGDLRIALIAYAGKTEHVQIGKPIVGWLLTTIENDSVVLERGAERVQLELRTFQTSPVANVASAVPSATEETDGDIEEPALEDEELLELISQEIDLDYEQVQSLRPRAS